MEKSFVRQTRSKAKAAKTSDPSSDVHLCTMDRDPDPSDDGFKPSMTDFEHGHDRDCAVCDRLNNAELYMVQCGVCKRWNHFSCARVDTKTVQLREFCCAQCSVRRSKDRIDQIDHYVADRVPLAVVDLKLIGKSSVWKTSGASRKRLKKSVYDRKKC